MTLRVRLALALSLLTAIAVTAMALVGYRSTATRLYQEIDRSLSSSSVRFADPDGRYAAQVCGRLGTNVPDDGGGGPIADLPGTAVQCLDRSGVRYAASSAEPLPIDSNDVLLAGRGPGRRSARWPTTGS